MALLIMSLYLGSKMWRGHGMLEAAMVQTKTGMAAVLLSTTSTEPQSEKERQFLENHAYWRQKQFIKNQV